MHKVLSGIPSYHTTPEEAVEAGRKAGVGLVALCHQTPAPPNRVAERIFTRGISGQGQPRWMLADDGTLIDLPPGSEEIVVGTVK